RPHAPRRPRERRRRSPAPRRVRHLPASWLTPLSRPRPKLSIDAGDVKQETRQLRSDVRDLLPPQLALLGRATVGAHGWAQDHQSLFEPNVAHLIAADAARLQGRVNACDQLFSIEGVV